MLWRFSEKGCPEGLKATEGAELLIEAMRAVGFTVTITVVLVLIRYPIKVITARRPNLKNLSINWFTLGSNQLLGCVHLNFVGTFSKKNDFLQLQKKIQLKNLKKITQFLTKFLTNYIIFFYFLIIEFLVFLGNA